MLLLFEVKADLSLDHGYKTVQLLKTLKLDLDKFNKDYGLTQLAEKTLKNFIFIKK
jgi:hypothetical protein